MLMYILYVCNVCTTIMRKQCYLNSFSFQPIEFSWKIFHALTFLFSFFDVRHFFSLIFPYNTHTNTFQCKRVGCHCLIIFLERFFTMKFILALSVKNHLKASTFLREHVCVFVIIFCSSAVWYDKIDSFSPFTVSINSHFPVSSSTGKNHYVSLKWPKTLSVINVKIFVLKF